MRFKLNNDTAMENFACGAKLLRSMLWSMFRYFSVNYVHLNLYKRKFRPIVLKADNFPGYV